MELYKKVKRNDKIYYDYKSELFDNIEFGIKVVAAAAKYQYIEVKRIRIEDGVRSSEGSSSTVINEIENISHFIEKYKNIELEFITLIGELKGEFITVGVLFDRKIIRIGHLKEYNFYLDEFVDKLELIANKL